MSELFILPQSHSTPWRTACIQLACHSPQHGPWGMMLMMLMMMIMVMMMVVVVLMVMMRCCIPFPFQNIMLLNFSENTGGLIN